MTLRLRTLLGVAILCLCAQAAFASHYPIEAVPFVPAENKAKLRKADLKGTEGLLNALLTKANRKALAKKTGIAVKELELYVKYCDLLRIRGVGPKMARLLILTGVDSIANLRTRKAATLEPLMQQTNKKHGVSEILPQPETIENWIQQARKLELIVK